MSTSMPLPSVRRLQQRVNLYRGSRATTGDMTAPRTGPSLDAPDFESAIGALRDKGLRVLVPPQPGEAFNDHEIAFLRAKYGLHIELIDTDERAGLL